MSEKMKYFIWGAIGTIVSLYIGYILTEKSNNKLLNNLKAEIEKLKAEIKQ